VKAWGTGRPILRKLLDETPRAWDNAGRRGGGGGKGGGGEKTQIWKVGKERVRTGV